MTHLFPSKIARCALVLSVLTLSACVTPPKPLYQWDQYQTHLYQSLNESGLSPQEFIQRMELTMNSATGKGNALPPGFRAQLGMLYSQTGQVAAARELWTAEKKYFPEATTFMDFLLNKTKTAVKD